MARALPTAARHHGDDEEDVDPEPNGCRIGITLSVLPPPEAAAASSLELLDA
jgi:hypothetical protein